MSEPRIWKPHPKQEQFIRLPFTVKEALYGGALGGGKTELLILLPLVYRFHLNSKFKGIILRRTFPELEKEIIIRSKEYYEAAGARYNEQKKFWKFPSGAHIFFGHAENEQDIKKYDGIEYNYIAFDELTHFTEFQYLYLAISRSRSSSPDLPAIVRCSSNPGNIGHAWVRKRFVEPKIEGNVIIQDKVSGTKRFFLPAKLQDNPTILKNNPNYAAELENLPESERRAKLYGDWFTFTGQVFDNFRIEPLSDEPDNARHVVEPFTIPDFWPKINVTDWGFTANTASLWGAIAPNGRVYIYREYVVKQTLIDTWATEIGEFNRQDKNLKSVVLDTNAWDERGEPETVVQQFERFSRIHELKLAVQKASKARVSGKMLVQEFLRWKQRPKISPVEPFDASYSAALLKHKGLEAYNEYMEQFKPQVDETNIPKLQIFSTCENLIKVIPLCIYDDKNREDVKEFDGDDVYDALRYLLKAIVQYMDESKAEFDRLRQLDEIQALAETRNFTAYHMARARIESLNKPTYGIPRFHKGGVQRVPGIEQIIGS